MLPEIPALQAMIELINWMMTSYGIYGLIPIMMYVIIKYLAALIMSRDNNIEEFSIGDIKVIKRKTSTKEEK